MNLINHLKPVVLSFWTRITLKFMSLKPRHHILQTMLSSNKNKIMRLLQLSHKMPNLQKAREGANLSPDPSKKSLLWIRKNKKGPEDPTWASVTKKRVRKVWFLRKERSLDSWRNSTQARNTLRDHLDSWKRTGKTFPMNCLKRYNRC